MADFIKQYALWDEFLSVWPAARLQTMTLDEYSQAGSKDSFTYWIESGLDELGSIWGGSSFKFGVFSRKDTEEKTSDVKLSYSDSHGWYSSLGATAEEAFEKVRGFVVQVADWAAIGDLNAIESFEYLGEAFKWKIAFHYQNRKTPTTAAIFKRAPLAIFVGDTAKQNMAILQQATMSKRPPEMGVLEFSRQVWEAWGQKNLDIWKLSHGDQPFTPSERKAFVDDLKVTVHKDTGKEQGKKFAEAPVGTLFFLCHGNSPQRIGQFTSEALPCSKGDGWLQRSYQVLKTAVRTDRYTANSKAWSPQGNSTFWQVGAHDLPEFEATLLKPFFATDLSELACLAGEPIESTTPIDASAQQATAPEAGIKTMAPCFNRIYYGPPGTGKTYTLMQLLKRDYAPQNYCFVTFHQSYGYEEFVEGLRPVLINKNESNVKMPAGENMSGEVKYEIRPGAFKELCSNARQAPDQRFAMVIDEINRGNISKIFGELITLIEPDKRAPLDGSAPPIELTLAYSGDPFSVPANVDIIGTMNTADRSLALLDTALRRRFDFVPLMPDTRATKEADDPHSAPLADLLVTTNAGAIDVRRMLERINERIEALYDRDHCIGHAYLTGLAGVNDGEARFDLLADIFRNRILPLLEEYFFEDWRKIRLVLGDNQKPESAQFISESDAHEQDLSELFGSNHDLDSYATKRRYQLQVSTFSNPSAYLGIYALAQ
ncbi:McrB family protein [Vibrio cholerae]|uniref:McrB family protein n=1 Tax=Vibrio cholerae TaxID=666 RepID=UPI000E0AFD45|nr:AAA family ATPase [Vibrio cholerae]